MNTFTLEPLENIDTDPFSPHAVKELAKHGITVENGPEGWFLDTGGDWVLCRPQESSIAPVYILRSKEFSKPEIPIWRGMFRAFTLKKPFHRS